MAKSSIFTGIYLSSKGLGTLDIFQFIDPDYIPVWHRSEKNQNPRRRRSWIVFSLNSLILREQGNALFWKWKESESEVAHSCPTLCDPMNRSLPGSSIHGIFQARKLEWGAISFSRGSSGKGQSCFTFSLSSCAHGRKSVSCKRHFPHFSKKGGGRIKPECQKWATPMPLQPQHKRVRAWL